MLAIWWWGKEGKVGWWWWVGGWLGFWVAMEGHTLGGQQNLGRDAWQEGLLKAWEW